MNLKHQTIRILGRVGQKPAIKIARAISRLKNLARYQDWHFFQQVFIEIYAGCNRSCHYCPVQKKTDPYATMTDALFELAISRLQEIRWSGAVGYTLFNEPTRDKRLCRFISMTKSMLPRSIPILFSNGDFMTPELADDLVESGLSRCTITRHPPFNPNWDKNTARIVSRHPAVFRLHQISETDLINVGGHVDVKAIWHSSCNAPTFAIPIRHNGDVGLCCCDYDRETVFGNITQNSLLEIWSGPEFKATRLSLRSGVRPIRLCKGCSGVV